MGVREKNVCITRVLLNIYFSKQKEAWRRLHFLEMKFLLSVLFLLDKWILMSCSVFFLFAYSMNRLNTLPRGFGSLPALEVLDLTYNNLNENSLPGNFFYLSKKLFWKLYKSLWYGTFLSAVEIYLMEIKLQQNFSDIYVCLWISLEYLYIAQQY